MADSTYNRESQPRARWFALAGLIAAAAGLFTALIARARLINRPSFQPPAVASTYDAPKLEPATRKPPDTRPSPYRTLFFMALTIILAVVLIVLQSENSPLAAPLFLLLVVGAVILAVAGAPPDVRRVVLTPRLAAGAVYRPIRAFLDSIIAFITRYRLLLSAASALGALVLMICSSYSFQVSRWYNLPIDEPAFFLFAGAAALGVSLALARPNIALPTLPAVGTRAAVRMNGWITGVGVAVLLLLSEINGKGFKVERLYPITIDTQFWILILGISLLVLGLSGWQPLLRLPPIRWRWLASGVVMLSGSLLADELAAAWVPGTGLQTLIDAALFITTRLGNLLLIWALLSGAFTLPRITLGHNRGTALLVVAALLVICLLASLSATFVLDIALGLATSDYFWPFMVTANLLRVVIAAFYRRSTPEALAVDAAGSREQETEHARRPFASHAAHYAALVAVLLVAVFARFHLLNDTMRFLIDEDSYLLGIHLLRANPDTPLLMPFSSIAAFPYIFPYFESKTVDLFGTNFAGLRGASAIIGALTVLALYGLGRTLFDRKTALVGALLLATFPPHVQFSRIGINEMSGPLVATLSFLFLARGLLHGHPVNFALGGVFLGLTHYFDEGSRLLFTPVAMAWVAACLLFALRHNRAVGQVIGFRLQASLGSRLFIGLVAALLVAFPIYYTLVALDRPLAGRMVDNRSGLPPEYWQDMFESGDFGPHIRTHLLPAFLVYTHYLDQTLFYAGDSPMLLWFVLPVAFLGISYLLWRWRAPGPLLLLFWVISVSLGNSLLTSSMSYPRFVLVFPALMLTAAVGLRYTIPLIIRRARWNAIVITLLAVGLSAGQLHFYFNDYLPRYNHQFRSVNASPDGYDAALRSADFPPNTQVHIISQRRVNRIEAVGLLNFVSSNQYLNTLTPDEFDDAYIDDMRCGVDHAFFIERNDFETLAKLRSKFYLREPQYTPYDDIHPSQRLILFYAPYIKGTEKFFGRKC